MTERMMKPIALLLTLCLSLSVSAEPLQPRSGKRLIVAGAVLLAVGTLASIALNVAAWYGVNDHFGGDIPTGLAVGAIAAPSLLLGPGAAALAIGMEREQQIPHQLGFRF